MLINLNFLLFNKRVEDSIAITRLMVLMHDSTAKNKTNA